MQHGLPETSFLKKALGLDRVASSIGRGNLAQPPSFEAAHELAQQSHLLVEHVPAEMHRASPLPRRG